MKYFTSCTQDPYVVSVFNCLTHVLTDHVSLIDLSEEMSHTGSYTARGYCLSAPRLPAVIVQMLAFVVKDLFLDEFLFQESASIGLVSLSPNE